MIAYLNTVFEASIDEYLNLISTKYGIKFSELKELLHEVKKGSPAQPTTKVTKQPAVIIPFDGKTCAYVYSRGLKKGNSCSGKPKKNGEFCSQHSKKNDEIVVTVPEPAVVSKKPNPVLRMNKIVGKWWHPDSGMVFKSSEEKIVIGIFRNEQINDLSEEDVATCVAHKFKYVTKVKKVEEEEEKKDVIDDQFIKVNQTAKNVEVLIKEMFDSKASQEDDDEEVIDDGGAAESKENYHHEDEVEDDNDIEEEELLEEEPDEEE